MPTTPPATSEQQYKRQQLQARYAREDFTEAIDSLLMAAAVLIGLGVILGAALYIFGSQNLPYILGAGVLASFFWLVHKLVDWWLTTTPPYVGALVYVALVVGQWLLFGWPDELIPWLDDPTHPRPAVATFFNAGTPFIIVGAELMLVYPFWKIQQARQRWLQLPELQRRNQTGGKLRF